MGKIVEFEKDVSRYRKLAEECAQKGDFKGALAFLFSAKSISESYEVLMDIAYNYADMGLLELSNKFWFKYMDKAPKDRVSVAYEELAINYFYLDNYWASSYYFHLKLKTDGQIMKEGLDQEIIDFFSGEELKKDAYRIVYPIERANYDFETKRAKHALAIGAFPEAKTVLQKIPLERRTEEISGDLAVASFMSDDLDGAEKICRESISEHGENVTALCNLSTIYDMKEDYDNAEYYYKKALLVRKGEKGEEYKIATCAIERNDHDVVKECLEKILLDRPNELTMRFFYATCLLNTGKLQRAVEEFKRIYRISPGDRIFYYYLKLAERVLANDQRAVRLLPLAYVKELPEQTTKDYSERVKALVQDVTKADKAVKNLEMRNVLEWALIHGEGQTSRDAAFVFSMVNTPSVKKLFLDTLVDVEVKDEIKRVIIYVLAVNGYKGRFGLVSGCFYSKIKFKKLACEKDVKGGIYLSAYGLCAGRIALWDAENIDKAAVAVDKIYNKFKDKLSVEDVTNDEIAALIMNECSYKWCKTDLEITSMFNVEKQRFDKLKQLLKETEND